jgi:heptosyltransferase-2
MGDLILTTPFLRELRRNFPRARIVLLIQKKLFNLFEFCPYVDQVLTFPFPCHRTGLKKCRYIWQQMRFAFRYLLAEKFQLAILPLRDIDTVYMPFLVYMSGAVSRIGFTEKIAQWKSAFNKYFNWFYTDILPREPVLHDVEAPLRIIEYMGGVVQDKGLELWLGKEDEEFADRTMVVQNDELLICFAIGAGEEKRKWPIDRFVEVGAWLGRRYPARIVLLGSEDYEEELGRVLQTQLSNILPVMNLIKQTTIRQAAAVMKKVDLYVGHDTGLMHKAVAVKTPVIEISCWPASGTLISANGPRFNPWLVPFIRLNPRQATPPCTNNCNVYRPHCILGVSVEDVQRGIAEMLPALKSYRGQKDLITI